MNTTLDKLTPGWPAKLNLSFDLLVIIGATLLALTGPAWGDPGDEPKYISLAFLGVLAWLVGAFILRLYSPATPRSHADHLVLTLLLVIFVTISDFLWERIALPCMLRS